MGGFRLNGWQWMGSCSRSYGVVAFFIGRHMVYDAIYTTYDHCVDRTLDWSICDKTMDDALIVARKAEPITFAVVALIPT